MLTFVSEILVAPDSRVVFLNQSAVFTCETVGGGLAWVLNGTLRDVHSEEIRNDLIISEIPTEGDSKQETMTIPARAEYNGTRIMCAVLTLGGSALSENSTLRIQGI